MSLQSEASNSGADDANPSKTVTSAVALLQSLKPSISAILGQQKLRVALDRMDIMKPDRGDLEKAHVLWVGPALEGDDAKRLKDVCGMRHFFPR
jgi:activating signal cointegrator complex subunit 1